MKGNELIEKILNKEIKSGTLIKMKNHYPGLEWEKTICFNGNWFSEEEYYPGVSRYNDIILHLCSEHMTFEIIEEDKKIPEKSILDVDSDASGSYDTVIINGAEYQISRVERYMLGKINEIIDYINGGTND